MEGQVFQCPGCFTTIPAECIDFKTRRAVCPSCGNLVILKRRDINNSDKVVYDIKNAIGYFLDGNYEIANHFAESALSVAVDNAAALFIIAYYCAYSAEIKTRKYIDKYFYETLPDLELDGEEAEQCKKLWLKVVPHLVDYEKIILTKMLETQSASDLGAFVDSFSPYAIARRTNSEWLDVEMADLYKTINGQVDIPKTWFALYGSLGKNPDSPEIGDTYYLTTKASRFFNNYILRIGEIFSAIKSEALYRKFNGAFSNEKEKIKSKLKQAGGTINE